MRALSNFGCAGQEIDCRCDGSAHGIAVLCGKPLIEPEADALDVPGQQLYDAVNGMIGDALDDMPQIGFGIEAVRLGSFDQAVDRSCTLAAGIGTGEGPVAPAEGY